MFKAPQVSMRPTREGSMEASGPRSKEICGRPLSMAIGMGGGVTRGSKVWAEKDLASISMNFAFFKNGWRESDRRKRRRVPRWRKSGSGSGRRKRLSSRRARRGRSSQIVARKRITFAKMRFMSEEVLKEDGGGTRSRMLRAAAEYVLNSAAEHTTREAERVRALKISERVHRKLSRAIGGGRLITLHGLLGGRCKGASKARNVVGLVERNGRSWSSGRRDRSDGERSGKSGNRPVVL